MADSPVIAVEELSCRPGDAEAPVFQGLRFGVAPGDRTVLTGSSGAGKSTLLRCMVLLEPAEGRVLLDGEPVGPERVRELRRRVGYLPQRPVAIAGTVAENLAFPREVGEGPLAARCGAPLEEAEQRSLLGRLGLGDVPDTRRFDALSGGEQQRVALVRSLTTRPCVLLLDEPTASLDPENVDAVTGLLSDWLEEDPDRALVWVSHHSYQVEGLATRRVRMQELVS